MITKANACNRLIEAMRLLNDRGPTGYPIHLANSMHCGSLPICLTGCFLNSLRVEGVEGDPMEARTEMLRPGSPPRTAPRPPPAPTRS
jgi:hypothetical protein